MGRPPSGGGPVFRFLPNEVTAMEKELEETKGAAPLKESIQALADAFSAAPERVGKMLVQYKQVWNWFQNRRHAVRKQFRAADKAAATVAGTAGAVSPSSMEVSVQKRPPSVPPVAVAEGKVPDPSKMEFEAKSSRDTAWYDVEAFLGERKLESGEIEVKVRFSGFGQEEDEWVNVRTGVRLRSLPCEAAECVAVLPGDLILCFQEGNEEALYYDARVKEVERRRHDVRGCRCRFLVQYPHDGVLEIVPLRKVCRRPETEYRLLAAKTSSLSRSAVGPGSTNLTRAKESTEENMEPADDIDMDYFDNESE